MNKYSSSSEVLGATTYPSAAHVEGALITLSKQWERDVRRIEDTRGYSFSCTRIGNHYSVILSWNDRLINMGPPDYQQDYIPEDSLDYLPLTCTQEEIQSLVDEAMELIPMGEPTKQSKVA
jgi:hypothetical protein